MSCADLLSLTRHTPYKQFLLCDRNNKLFQNCEALPFLQ